MNDLINRKGAINAVCTVLYPDADKMNDAKKVLKEMPSAQPGQEPVEWIEHHEPNTWMGYTYWSCPNCGFECGYDKEIRIKTDFCPNCGADMRGEQDG